MTDTQSYLFDFERVPMFFDKMNISYKLLEMNSSNNFQLVFSDYASDNIQDCLNLDGTLNTTNVHIAQSGSAVVDFSLKWDNEIISVRNDTTWTVGDANVFLKAVFIRNKATGFVLGYCIHMNSFDVTNTVTLPKDTILWSIQDG